MMEKNDSEVRKLRELSNGDRAWFLFHWSWGRTAKNSVIELILEEIIGVNILQLTPHIFSSKKKIKGRLHLCTNYFRKPTKSLASEDRTRPQIITFFAEAQYTMRRVKRRCGFSLRGWSLWSKTRGGNCCGVERESLRRWSVTRSHDQKKVLRER
jgi:hypothetical protein